MGFSERCSLKHHASSEASRGRVGRWLSAPTRSTVALLLCLTLPAGSVAQTPSAQSAIPPSDLRIIVLEGQNAVNSTSGQAVAPVVEVRDFNDLPVADAQVTFRVPDIGASGLFEGNSRSLTVRTNLQGQATVRSFRSNGVAGRFRMAIEARAGQAVGRTQIIQSNQAGDVRMSTSRSAPEPHRRKTWLWVLLAGAAAGGGAAGFLMTRGNDRQPVGVVVGPPAFGAPR